MTCRFRVVFVSRKLRRVAVNAQTSTGSRKRGTVKFLRLAAAVNILRRLDDGNLLERTALALPLRNHFSCREGSDKIEPSRKCLRG